ncbi:Fimbrin, actin-bundling protein, partial [Pichia californica]
VASDFMNIDICSPVTETSANNDMSFLSKTDSMIINTDSKVDINEYDYKTFSTKHPLRFSKVKAFEQAELTAKICFSSIYNEKKDTRRVDNINKINNGFSNNYNNNNNSNKIVNKSDDIIIQIPGMSIADTDIMLGYESVENKITENAIRRNSQRGINKNFDGQTPTERRILMMKNALKPITKEDVINSRLEQSKLPNIFQNTGEFLRQLDPQELEFWELMNEEFENDMQDLALEYRTDNGRKNSLVDKDTIKTFLDRVKNNRRNNGRKYPGIEKALGSIICQRVKEDMDEEDVFKKYPILDQSELFALIEDFRNIDINENGWADKKDVIDHVSKGGKASYDEVREALKNVSVDASGHVELDDFVELNAKLKESKQSIGGSSSISGNDSTNTNNNSTNTTSSAFRNIPGSENDAETFTRNKAKVVLGNAGRTLHTIDDEERVEFTRHINSVLVGDSLVGNRVPFDLNSFQLFDECTDGLVLSSLINDSVPDTIDTRVLNLPKNGKPLNNFKLLENANIVLNSAKAIGCVVVNVHTEDIVDGKETLILGLIWQIIRRGLLSKIDIKLHPELYRLLEDDETLEQFFRLPPEKILLRWFNYHLKAANWHRKVNNFSQDVADGENYTILLNQLAPELCSKSPLQTPDLLQRAEQVLSNADKLDCRKYLTPKSLVAGNPKLNLAFVAHLFNTHPGLDPIQEEEKIDIEDFDAEGEREARVFTLWLNSLDVNPPVISLFEDLKDGNILLEAYDKVMPGSVDWRHINKRPTNGNELMRFKALENTNYCVSIGKANHFSLVGIDGSDITDGNKMLTLGLVWQLMRRNINNTLSSLSVNGKEVSDKDILKWANDTVAKGGKTSSIRSFKDATLSNGHFLLDILHSIKPGYVDYDLVLDGNTEEERYANAKLAISIARKLGALIWLVPEDINEVRSRLILTFVGSLMSLKV